MDRRAVLRLAAALPLPFWLGGWDRGGQPVGALGTLILIELKGGNDGLNTIAPIDNPTYRAARPGLALDRSQALDLGSGCAAHPALAPLLPLWRQQSLAVVHGLGYDQPNRSHFRSIDIWETACGPTGHATGGWIDRCLPGDAARWLDACMIGRRPGGTCRGSSLRAVTVQDIERFCTQADQLGAQSVEGVGAAHLAATADMVREAAGVFRQRVLPVPTPTGFPDGKLGAQAALCARLLRAGIRPPVMTLSLSGFDTHAQQAEDHAALLAELATCIAGLAATATELGIWPAVCIATYSEFGRRLAENGSGGTDHGAAACHLVCGGGVQGGHHGVQPTLDDLDRGDIRCTTDYRSYWRSLAEHCWQATAAGRAIHPDDHPAIPDLFG